MLTVVRDACGVSFLNCRTNFTPRVTCYASSSLQLDLKYYQCWQGLKKYFDPNRIDPVV